LGRAGRQVAIAPESRHREVKNQVHQPVVIHFAPTENGSPFCLSAKDVLPRVMIFNLICSRLNIIIKISWSRFRGFF
jgi:hypothetical protein